MQRAFGAALRVVGLGMMAFLVAHCGDSDVRVRTGGGVEPDAGVFTGTTSDGGDIVINVGSIESIVFDCEDNQIQEIFTPREPVNSDGSFDVSLNDEGRDFRVQGTFTDNNNVQGTIDDDDDDCDVSFSASRSGGPTRTPTPATSGGLTPTPALTPTGGEPTSTGETSGATPTGPTPTGATPTGAGTGTPTDGATPCPSKLTLEGQGSQADLDTGFSGLAFDQTVVNKGTVTVALDCGSGTPGNCGDCDVSGPIASTTSVNNHRCRGDNQGNNGSSIECTSDTDCPGTGNACTFFFGAPLPLASGGVGVCVTNEVFGQITGMANPDTGSGSSSVTLHSKVHTGQLANPCPRCSGAGFGATGTCDSGPRQGEACTVHGTSDLFGNTSFDCAPEPGANVSGANGLNIALNPTTGTSTLQPSNTCAAFPFTGKACYCPSQVAPNNCADGICAPDATGEGTCSAPTDFYCASETFRPCTTGDDCPNNDCSLEKPRKCHGETDADFDIVGPIVRTGTPSVTNPVLVSTFCIPAVAAAAVNSAAGLPGPGALRLPSTTCFGDSCSF